MNEELREDRVREVVQLFRQAELFGTPAVISNDGMHVGVTYSAAYGADDDAAEEEALAEAFVRGTAGDRSSPSSRHSRRRRRAGPSCSQLTDVGKRKKQNTRR